MSRQLCTTFSALALGCAVALTGAQTAAAQPTESHGSAQPAIDVAPDLGDLDGLLGGDGIISNPTGEGVWP